VVGVVGRSVVCTSVPPGLLYTEFDTAKEAVFAYDSTTRVFYLHSR